MHSNNPGGAKLPKDKLQEIKECTNFTDLFHIVGSTLYWNAFDIRLLQDMARASLQKNATYVISIFKKVVYPKRISKYYKKKLIDSPNKNQPEFSYYTQVKEVCNKDAELFTVEDFVEHRKYLEREKLGIEGFLAFLGFDYGSLIFSWLIPTTVVYYAYNSAKSRCFLPDGIVSLEITGCSIITFTTENNTLSIELQQIQCE